MNFKNILFILTICVLAFAKSRNLHIKTNNFNEIKKLLKNVVKGDSKIFNLSIIQINDGIEEFEKTFKGRPFVPKLEAHFITENSKHQTILFNTYMSPNAKDPHKKHAQQAHLNKAIVNKITIKEFGPKIANCSRSVAANKSHSIKHVGISKLGTILKSNPKKRDHRKIGNCSLVVYHRKSINITTVFTPHFNLLPKLFPHIQMVAFNLQSHKKFDAVFDTPGLALITLYHNGNIVAKHNTSKFNVTEMAKFILTNTYYTPKEKMEVLANILLNKPVLEIELKTAFGALTIFAFIIWGALGFGNYFYALIAKWFNKFMIEYIFDDLLDSDSE